MDLALREGGMEVNRGNAGQPFGTLEKGGSNYCRKGTFRDVWGLFGKMAGSAKS